LCQEEKIIPCFCWYDPPEASKKLIKNLCQKIVDELNRLNREGDPIGLQLKDVKELLDHLSSPHKCDEKLKDQEEK
jgi:hypothetical protein